jgi:hypothetical protein
MISLPNAPARSKPSGLVLYQGPSQLDGKPIVVIATGLNRPSANAKTGNMIQTWILPADHNPLHAIHTGADMSVCGSCPMRGILEQRGQDTVNRWRSCYVQIHQAPLAIYHAYQRGRYQPFDRAQHLTLFRNRMIRFGAYGDPVAAPYEIWTPLLKVAKGWTGYTHQWQERRFWRYRRFLMASCETLADTQQAQARGWRTFRTAPAGESTARGEFHCPASAEQNHRLTCEQCGACNGTSGNAKRASVLIWAHGSPATLGAYRRLSDDS